MEFLFALLVIRSSFFCSLIHHATKNESTSNQKRFNESGMNNTIVIGKQGEDLAVQYLRSIGCKIYKRNERLRHDEIDVIAYDPLEKIIIFAEVKARSRFTSDYLPSINLTHRKRMKMRRAANAWIARHEYDGMYRFDAICIAAGRILEHRKELRIPQARLDR